MSNETTNQVKSLQLRLAEWEAKYDLKLLTCPKCGRAWGYRTSEGFTRLFNLDKDTDRSFVCDCDEKGIAK